MKVSEQAAFRELPAEQEPRHRQGQVAGVVQWDSAGHRDVVGDPAERGTAGAEARWPSSRAEWGVGSVVTGEALKGLA